LSDWVVLREGERRRSGGDLRRRFLFDGLVDRTHATALEDRRAGTIRTVLASSNGQGWRWWRRPAVATSEILTDEQLMPVLRFGRAVAVDFHDEPVSQAVALGLAFPPEIAQGLAHRMDANRAAFELHVVPSESLAQLIGLAPRQTILAPNGSETNRILPGPFPSKVVVGMLSGAGPGRGIEMLIDAVELLRTELPDISLQLSLVSTGEASEAYLGRLRSAVESRSFVTIATVPYGELSEALARATILCIPHPPSAYWDAILPIKLFDSMAAGRPVVLSPRAEMAAVVTRFQCGIISAGDRSEDFADAIARVATNRTELERMGSNARQAAVQHFDWRVIGARLADEVIARTARPRFVRRVRQTRPSPLARQQRLGRLRARN
jgi:glycosyltransferase involved in cell wall biosynthesis